MKCKDLKKQIDLALKGDSLELEQSYKSHIDSCDDCREYYNQAVRLAGLLSSQKFEVLPGELDDITFEKIALSRKPEKKSGYLQNIFSIRWAWVPAAAAILIIFALFPKSVNKNGPDSEIDIIDWWSTFSTSVPEGLDSTVLTGIVGSDTDLELLEDVIINNSEVDNLIESLSDEEFDILYERLNSKSGSA